MQGIHQHNSLFKVRSGQLLKNQYGILLLEYMLAMVIGLSMVLFIFEVHRCLKASHRFIQSVYLAFTEAETLITLINQEVHAAGRMGCEKINEQHLVYDSTQQIFRAIFPLTLSEHAIRLMHTDAGYVLLLVDAAKGHAALRAAESLSLRRGDWIIISDCIHTELTRVANVYTHAKHEQTIHLEKPLHFAFKKSAMIAKFVIVDINTRKRHAREIVSLTVNGSRTAIAEYIENLTFYLIGSRAIHYEFDVAIGGIHKKWYGYAAQQ